MKLSVKKEKLTALWATIKGKSSWHTCLRPALFSTISFIYYFILFNRRKSPNPQINVVCSKRMIWGSQIQHWFWWKGVRVHRGSSLRASSPFGGNREKYTREWHASDTPRGFAARSRDWLCTPKWRAFSHATGEGGAKGAILTLLTLIVVTVLYSRSYDFKICIRARNIAGHSRNMAPGPQHSRLSCLQGSQLSRGGSLLASPLFSCLPTKLQETLGEVGHLSKVVYAMFTIYKNFPGFPFWKVNETRFSGRSNPVENFVNKSNVCEDSPIFLKAML